MLKKNLPDDETSLTLQVDNLTLSGNLTIPEKSHSLIIFAHGSGSGRLSPRNRLVASALNKEGFATLLFDLLTTEEETTDDRSGEFRFNIPLLAKRLVTVTQSLVKFPELHHLSVGYFGASTGAGAALIAAAELPDVVKAVVSRGGRPDLAGDALSRVHAPTLLIVGGLDTEVITLNETAMKFLHSETKLEIVPGATHLFEEPGTLEKVTSLASVWFKKYL